MERQGSEVHVNTEEASGGSKPHIVRYVLFFSLILAIVALSAIWITGAFSTSNDSGGYQDTARVTAEAQ